MPTLSARQPDHRRGDAQASPLARGEAGRSGRAPALSDRARSALFVVPPDGVIMSGLLRPTRPVWTGSSFDAAIFAFQ